MWIPDPSVADAIHDNVAGEIAAVTEKASPVSADLLLIEDSEAANAKKRVQVGNLPGGGGGGSSWGDLVLPDNGPAGSEDDEFDDETIDGNWTQVTVSGNAIWDEVGDVLSVTYDSQSSGDAAAILKAIPGTPAAPLDIRTAVRLLGVGATQLVGLIFTDGTVSTSNQIHLRWNFDNGLVSSGGTLTNLQASILKNVGSLVVHGPWLHMRLMWVSSNTFRLGVSIDGKNWTALAQTDISHTLTPTHYGLFVSRFGGTQPAQAAFEYFRVA